jgi:hypothetical protein
VVSNLCFTKLEPIEGKVLQEINKINWFNCIMVLLKFRIEAVENAM